MDWYTVLLVILAFLIAQWSIKEPLVAAPISSEAKEMKLPSRYSQAVEGDLVVGNPLPPA